MPWISPLSLSLSLPFSRGGRSCTTVLGGSSGADRCRCRPPSRTCDACADAGDGCAVVAARARPSSPSSSDSSPESWSCPSVVRIAVAVGVVAVLLAAPTATTATAPAAAPACGPLTLVLVGVRATVTVVIVVVIVVGVVGELGPAAAPRTAAGSRPARRSGAVSRISRDSGSSPSPSAADDSSPRVFLARAVGQRLAHPLGLVLLDRGLRRCGTCRRVRSTHRGHACWWCPAPAPASGPSAFLAGPHWAESLLIGLG